MDETASVEAARWRAALSALLDGEEPHVLIGDLAAHLAHCSPCSEWLDEVTAVNRELRMLTVLQPDLGERIVDAVDVHLCGCRSGGPCRCGHCQCGPHCTCHRVP